MTKEPRDITTVRREEIALREIKKALRGIRYGSLTITVQDGVVVQIDKTVKARLDYSTLDRVSDGEGI